MLAVVQKCSPSKTMKMHFQFLSINYSENIFMRNSKHQWVKNLHLLKRKVTLLLGMYVGEILGKRNIYP